MDRHDDLHSLEERLRRDKPEPRPGFLTEMAARLAAPPARAERSERRRLRLGLAFGFATLFAAAFAAMGAFGYAGSAARNALEGTFGSVEKVVKADQQSGRSSSSPRSQTAPEPVPSEEAVDRRSAAAASGGLAFSSRASSQGTKASLFQYPRFVVVCVQFGPFKPFTIVIPRFLVPFFEPFIVNFGPCESDRGSDDD